MVFCGSWAGFAIKSTIAAKRAHTGTKQRFAHTAHSLSGIFLVEVGGIEPPSKIPTHSKHSYAIGSFLAIPIGGCHELPNRPRAYRVWHTSTTLFFVSETRKTGSAGYFFDLRRLPTSSRYVVLEDPHQSGSNPISHKSGKSRVDHNDILSVVVSLFL